VERRGDDRDENAKSRIPLTEQDGVFENQDDGRLVRGEAAEGGRLWKRRSEGEESCRFDGFEDGESGSQSADRFGTSVEIREPCLFRKP
jgi:hypothetical protein